MRTVVRISMALVAVAAFALSFQSLMELGALAGYGRLAFLYPVVVDLGTVSSCTAWLATRSREAFWMTWTLLGISVVQNGTVHWLIATGQRPEWWLVTLVATVPPLVLGLTVHLGVGLASSEKIGPAGHIDLSEGSNGNFENDQDRADTSSGQEEGVIGAPTMGLCPPVAALSHNVDQSDPVAQLIESGVGRRKLAEALNITEHRARKLVEAARNGHADV